MRRTIILIGAMAGLVIAATLFFVWRAPGARPIRFGERQEALLRPQDSFAPGSVCGPKHFWSFQAEAGQRITLTVTSYEFDPSVQLLGPLGRPIGWSEDDDWFFTARLRATLPVSGRYMAIVCGTNADQYGTYWITLRQGDEEPLWRENDVFAFFRRGLEWAERQRNLRAQSWLHLALGRYLREHRRWKEAEAHYAQSEQVAKEAAFSYGRWFLGLERAALLARHLQYEEAIAELERALDFAKNLRAAEYAEALTLTRLGDLHRSLDRHEAATAYYRRALVLTERLKHPTLLVPLYASLSEFLRLSERERAFAYAERAYALREGVDPLLRFLATYRFAETRIASGKIAEGLRIASEARDLARRLGCRDQESAILLAMSIAYFSMNDPEGIVRSAREALELTDPNDDDPNPRRMALQMQADGEMLRGRHEEALQLCTEALRVTERAWARAPIEELRQRFLSWSKAISTQIIRNLYTLYARHPNAEYARQAFDAAERSRSRTLLEQLAALKVGSAVRNDIALLEEERAVLDRLSALGRQLVLARSSGTLDASELNRLEEERARLLNERIQLEARIRRMTAGELDKAWIAPLTAERVQREYLAAHPNAAILFYQLGVRESFLVVLTRETAHFFKLPNWTTIRDTVNEWRAHIRRQVTPEGRTPEALRAYARVAHRLYELLLRPAAHVIRGRELVIIPDAALHDLAFEALVVNPPDEGAAPAQEGSDRARSFRPRYLIEEHSVVYTPSVSVLVEIAARQKRTASSGRVLLIGDPIFNADDPRAKEAAPTLVAMNTPAARWRGGLHRLPLTEREVWEIAALSARHGLRPTVWLGREASEENLKGRDLTKYRFVHLATHAVADPQDGDFSAVVLSLVGRDSREDGVLTAAEIARLRLNADLVVLSGCETGTGQKTAAESVIGLGRAFLLAGARRICGSLWKVEDAATQQLMVRFYHGLLARDLTAAHALRQAKLHLLRQGLAPFYWAPFVLVGAP
ncbi:MAG: CHAT domain-containing protein [Blastocatellia bacterium]|nr:CHAT domain-containing protein [Blastocatellia bacterium]